MVVTVRLAIVGASPAAVEMFVPDVPRRGRGQLLDDLATQLDGEARFVPVRMTSRVRLVSKHAIAWISVERREAGSGDLDEVPAEPAVAPAEIPEELTLFDHQHFVEVELVQGSKLIGTLLDSAPAEHARVGDHLNHSGRWLRLWTTDQHYLINIQQVVAVTELGEMW